MVLPFLGVAILAASSGQWTHRYPKVTGFSHHVYLEGYELPVLNPGPSDPAPAPDGSGVAISARGYLWLYDESSGRARRLTHGGDLDSRPRWSPDGRSLVFVRDRGDETSIVQINVASGEERVLVEEPAIDLDPVYSLDGASVFYSSAIAGDLDLWRLDLASGARTRLTEASGLELSPIPISDHELVYVSKVRGSDSISILDSRSGTTRALVEEPIASQMRPAVHPDGRRLAAPLPGPDSYELWLLDIAGEPRIRVAKGEGLPLFPAFSHDGDSIYFVEADSDQRFHLMKVSIGGGEPHDVSPRVWEWGGETARVEIRTRIAGKPGLAPARISVRDNAGHPALHEAGQPRFDSQNGRVYLYSTGILAVEAPAGDVRVEAVQGLSTPPVSRSIRVDAGETAVVDLELSPLWSAGDGGWYSGDHHFHLNYGGTYRLPPESLVEVLRAEDLDVATPLMANLHTRLNDLEWFSWARLSERPLIAFGQEVRPHFLGHMGLIGTSSPHWPWYWGPGYPVYGRDDRPNGSALEHSRRERGINAFVHPVSTGTPFPEDGPPEGLPLALVPEAMAGTVDTLEIACLWSDEIGTTEAWYRLLNVGIPIVPSAGTDAFSNFYRSMAVGTTRVYVNVEGALSYASYLDGLRAGRSFVTTGPFLEFRIGGVGPGSVVEKGQREFEIRLASAVPVERVEVVVNGNVVFEDAGLPAPGKKTYTGKVSLPAGGWVAARARGGPSVWPAMDSYSFAHTAPLWIGSVGSLDPETARTSARELLAWLDVADKRLAEGYQDAAIPHLQERFRDARRKLVELSERRREP
jgi:TolB protein